MINEVYDLPRDNRSTSVDDIEGLLDFYHTNRHDFITTLIKTSPDRLHTILPGMINLITIARYFGGDELHISNYGVREGYLIRKIKERGVEHVR
jgi:exopolyphosphatase/guanosine-5'-triphosphate,3'-diphosphate pyrophosphatase